MKKLVLLAMTAVSLSAVSAHAGVHWSVVKSCPQGLEIIRGQTYAPAQPSVSFQANLGRGPIESLSLQLHAQVARSIYGLVSPRWGEFFGTLSFEDSRDGSRKVALKESGSDLVLLVLDESDRVIADYQFHGCR